MESARKHTRGRQVLCSQASWSCLESLIQLMLWDLRQTLDLINYFCTALDLDFSGCQMRFAHETITLSTSEGNFILNPKNVHTCMSAYRSFERKSHQRIMVVVVKPRKLVLMKVTEIYLIPSEMFYYKYYFIFINPRWHFTVLLLLLLL